MNGMLAVMAREARTRTLVPLAGLLSGIMVLVVGTIVGGRSRIWEVGDSSVMLGYLFLGIAGAALGVTMVGRDLAGARSAFYLSKPIGVWSIYFGKVIAAIVIALVSAVLFVLPGLLVARSSFVDSAVVGLALFLAVSVVPICAALEVLAKARNAHLILWALLSAGILWLGWTVGGPFREAYAHGIFFFHVVTAITAVAVGTMISHAAAFASARYDVRRQARRFAILYGSIIGGVALTLVLAAWTLLHLPISLLGGFGGYEIASPVVQVAGEYGDSGWANSFLLDLETGALRRIPPASSIVAGANEAFVYDGNREEGSIVEAIPLTGGGDRKQTGIVIGKGEWLAAVSADGRLFAIGSGTTTQIRDREGRTVATLSSADLATDYLLAVREFDSSGALWLVEQGSDQPWRVRRLASGESAAETIARFKASGRPFLLGDDLLVANAASEDDPPEHQVIERATGEIVLRIPSRGTPVPLRGGGWAFIDGSAGRIMTIDDSGAMSGHPLELEWKGRILAEIRPGVALVRETPDGLSEHDLNKVRLHAVDLASGTVLRSYQATRPVVSQWPRPFEPLAPAARLVETEEGLRMIDPGTLDLVPAVR